jgi:hypothetical protein
VIDVELRFLQLVERRVAQLQPDGELRFVDDLQVGSERILAWDEAVERRFPLPGPIALTAGEEHERLDAPHGSSDTELDVSATIAPDGSVGRAGVVVRVWEALSGHSEVRLDRVGPTLWRVTASLVNTSPWTGPDRSNAQRRSLLSAHIVLRVRDGAFVSATDPPAELTSQVQACENVGLWPVLVGNEAERERTTLLASPIILYDYPQIAPESPTLLFDSGEIDQMLMLNTLTLTDDEKAEMRATDPRTRAILERAESLTAEDFGRLNGAIRDLRVLRSTSDPTPTEDSAATHGWRSIDAPPADAATAVRGVWPADAAGGEQAQEYPEEREFARLMGLERPTPTSVLVNGQPVARGTLVRLRPHQGADIFDLALAGRIATVESIEQDYEERVHLAVTLHDDPGADLGAMRLPGHRFFFSPDEVEPLR